MSELPLVSVAMITYNHEQYIVQAIAGVLMQETDFEYELVIANDCSTDATNEKITKILSQYPNANRIRYINHKKNLGMIPNFVDCLESCKGKYIALCEGDDYWTEPFKLQKQVDFLEQHANYSATAHQTLVKHENQKKSDHLFNNLPETDIELKDLFSHRRFHTASFVFRRECFDGKSFVFSNITSGDKLLFLLCGYWGKLHFFAEPMAVYRKNDGGISSWVTVELIKRDLNMIPALQSIYPSFPKFEYLSFIYKSVCQNHKNLSNINLFRYYLLYVFYSFSFFPRNLRGVAIFTITLLREKFS